MAEFCNGACGATMEDMILKNAIKRIIELETMLLIPVENAVWPQEVELVISQIDGAENLPESHQKRLRHHINRMWLEKMQMPSIISVATVLAATLGQYA
ncbi:hypothetical protein [Serratia aquatilis]|uniref:Uncharacterized protein n=1 Tax=Serratia aquatilis TaxID=1737515 RepID=A0ABV6E9H8_9GAMM